MTFICSSMQTTNGKHQRNKNDHDALVTPETDVLRRSEAKAVSQSNESVTLFSNDF